jgi:hypothetical protein
MTEVIKSILLECLDFFLHTVKDTIYLLPFLFLSYLLMEFIEHKTSDKMLHAIKHSGKFGPFFGALSGLVPQCGFSALASTLYAGKLITTGTVLAVFLSTSDEMLPIMISKSVKLKTILLILGAKLVIALIIGFAVDMFFRVKTKAEHHHHHEIEEFCDHEHCHCEKGIFRSSLYHTLHVFLFIFIISFILNVVLHYIGEDTIAAFLIEKPIVGQAISALIGLIPSCVSSVLITELFLQGAISAGSMLAGLLVAAGTGLLVLFRTNKHIKENLVIIAILYTTGLVFGILLDAISFGSLLV